MRPLIIDNAAKAMIERLKKNAEKNIISLDELKEMAIGKATIIGNRPGFSMLLQFGYRVVFSISQQNIGLCRELSMSVDSPNKLPNPSAVELVIKEFGFHHSFGECLVRAENNDAVYVMEVIDIHAHQKFMNRGTILSVVPPLKK